MFVNPVTKSSLKKISLTQLKYSNERERASLKLFMALQAGKKAGNSWQKVENQVAWRGQVSGMVSELIKGQSNEQSVKHGDKASQVVFAIEMRALCYSMQMMVNKLIMYVKLNAM